MAKLGKLLIGILALVGTSALLAICSFVWTGLSARPEPPSLEIKVARSVRRWMIPGSTRSLSSPLAASDELLVRSMQHWADHCAQCHANDGSGGTSLGQSLYPRAPDMRLPATQELSDGELFWIIENGIKLTGMPAWGNPASAEDDEESWELVHFIRHLPELTDREQAQMKRFNPVSRDEIERQQAIERFLAGDSDSPPPAEENHDHSSGDH